MQKEENDLAMRTSQLMPVRLGPFYSLIPFAPLLRRDKQAKVEVYGQQQRQRQR
jgi:hypothetical protein